MLMYLMYAYVPQIKKKKLRGEKKIFTIEWSFWAPKEDLPRRAQRSVDCLWQAKQLLSYSLCNCSYEKEIRKK